MFELTLERRSPRRRAIRLGTREQSREVVDGIVAANLGSTARGESVSGRLLGEYKSGPRAGARITLRRTGRMMQSLSALRVTRAGGQVAYRVPYAKYVLRRHPGALGLPPDIAERAVEVYGRALRGES